MESTTDLRQIECSEDREFKVRIIYKFTKTSVLFYSWICLGLYSEVLGPSLLTLMHQVAANYEEIGGALSWRAAGLFIGSLGGGVVHDRYRKHRGVILGVTLVGSGLTTILIARCRSLIALSAVLFFAGCTHGLHTTGGNPSLGDLWQEKAAGPYNFMHAGYGLGAALAPILMIPFTWTLFPGNTTYTNATLTSVTSLIEIVYPYGIVATFCFICAGLFTFCWIVEHFHLFGVPTITQAQPDIEENPEEIVTRITNLIGWKKRLRYYLTSRTFVMMCITFIVYFCLVGKERVFGKFLFSYATKGPLHVSTNGAYILNTLYWVFFCLARLGVALLAFRFSIQRIFLAEMLGTLVCAIVLNSAPYSRGVFFVFATLFGTCKSPLFPTALGVLNRYIEVNGRLVLVVNIGSACGAMLLQYLAGYCIQTYGQSSYLYIVLCTVIILLIVGIGLLFVGRIYGDRFPPQVHPKPAELSEDLKKKGEDEEARSKV